MIITHMALYEDHRDHHMPMIYYVWLLVVSFIVMYYLWFVIMMYYVLCIIYY